LSTIDFNLPRFLWAFRLISTSQPCFKLLIWWIIEISILFFSGIKLIFTIEIKFEIKCERNVNKPQLKSSINDFFISDNALKRIFFSKKIWFFTQTTITFSYLAEYSNFLQVIEIKFYLAQITEKIWISDYQVKSYKDFASQRNFRDKCIDIYYIYNKVIIYWMRSWKLYKIMIEEYSFFAIKQHKNTTFSWFSSHWSISNKDSFFWPLHELNIKTHFCVIA
jgi:hypothetical protein